MTDQPVNFANTLMAGGSQGVGSVPLRVNGVAAQTAKMVELRLLPADVQPIFSIDKFGTVAIGVGGSTAPDTSFSRNGPGVLIANQAFQVANSLLVIAGNVGVGGSPSANQALTISGAVLSGSAPQYGIVSDAAYSSAASEGDAVRSRVNTQAAAWTLANGRAFHALNPVKGAGSSINSVYGLLVDALTAGGVDNYGIRVSTPSGGSGDNVAISAAGDVVLGGGGLGSGLNTTDSAGFIFVPVMSGAPTGAPSTSGDHANHVPMVYDQTNQKLWFRQGGTWRGVVVA